MSELDFYTVFTFAMLILVPWQFYRMARDFFCYTDEPSARERDTAKSGRDDEFWSDVSESLRKGSVTASRALPSGDRIAEAMRSAAIILGDGYWDRDGQWKRFDRQQTEILEEIGELESKKFYQEFRDQQAANGAMSEDNEMERLQKSMQDLSANRINKKLEEQRRKILEGL